MPAIFAHEGLKFQYPENWSLVGQSLDVTPMVIELQAPVPVSAFWNLYIYPADSDAGAIVDEFRDAMAAEYEGLEWEEIDELEEDEVVLGYDMSFYCLDFLITSQIRCWRFGNVLFLTHTQGEDRDFEEASPIFRAMTVSLMRESKV